MPESDPIVDALYGCMNRLGLTCVEGDTHVGSYRDFPFAMTPTVLPGIHDVDTGAVEPASLSIVAQLRYVGAPEGFAPDLGTINNPTLRPLIDDKRLRITFDDTIAWLTIHDVDAAFLDDEFSACLDAILQVVQRAGGKADGKICHYCRSRSVESLTWIEERVAQVCGQCLEEKLDEARRERRGSVSGMMLLLLCAAATIAGAACWMLLWWIDSLVIEWITPAHQTEVKVPYYLIAGEVFGIGIATGALVGFITTLTRRAGSLAPRFAAALAAIGAALIGEMAPSRWIYQSDATFGVFSYEVPDLRDAHNSASAMELTYRFGALAVAMVVAAFLAKTRSPE